MRSALLILLAIAAPAYADPGAELDVEDVDFGQLAFNTTSVQYLTVANVGSAPRSPLVVTSAQIEGDPSFTFADPACAGATTCAFAPALSITGTAALVAVQCTASEPGTTVEAQVTFISNSNDSFHSTATLLCATQNNTVEFAPPSISFGSVDIRAPKPPTVLAHLENQTSSDIAITMIGFMGTGAARFTTATLPGAIAPANGSLAIPITYTPTAEGITDMASLEVTLPSGTLTVALDGTGVDRHAMIVSLPTFPDTLLEPGYAATLEPIVIGNTGGAVLELTNPTITGSPVWSFVNAGPVDVPGMATYPLMVRFAPTTPGPAPQATFSVMTNDLAHPTLTAMLGGSGVDRQAVMTPAVVDLDYAGIGNTVHASDPSRDTVISVVNNDPTNTYAISGIQVFGGEGAFDVLGASGTIAPGQTRTFDVSFTPPHEGDFTATASLFLDFDPTPEASVTLQGTGMYVEAHGAGCNAAGGDAGGAIALIIAIGFCVRRRRRTLVAVLFVGGTASAQSRDLDLAVFDPAPTTGAPTFAIPTADIGADGRWIVDARLSFASDPLVLTAPTNDNATLRDRTTLALGGAFAFGEIFEVAAHVPLYVQSGEDLSSSTMYGEPDVSATAFGDLELDGKALVSRYSGPAGELATGVTVAVLLPTASGQQFAGSAKPEVRALYMAHYALPILGERIALDADAGGVIRGSTQYDNIDQRSGFDWGGGVSVRTLPHLAFSIEAFGELVPGGIVDSMGNTRVLDTAEALAGAHYQVDHRINIGLAMGRGLTDELGSPDFRGIVSVTVAPAARRELDVTQRGGDEDHDGIPDDLDRCPTQPEDKDGFEDADGCPDPDNDHDGIPDAQDKCPNDPEDKDGFQDADGCPDPDNDGDGIPDQRDRCPNEPETINGFQDEDGCPDAGAGLVSIEGDRLVLGAQIDITNGKIEQASFGLLGQIGATLRAHAELVKLRIVARDEARAGLVRDWLVQYGIAADRLDVAADPNEGDRVDVLIAGKR
ncbi:MAG TPA: choice-of-anchor D domain-containing protein [Kofleriaceae bacterium]|jgi:hypothetical protein